MEMTFDEVLSPTESILFESLRWNPGAGCFQWVDILRSKLYRWFEKTGNVEIADLPFQYLPLAIPLAADRTLVASDTEIYEFSWASGDLYRIAAVPALASVRLNDGNFDERGDLWVGSMHVAGEGQHGSLYRVTPAGEVICMADQLGISNGVVPHPAGGVLHIDTPTRRVTHFLDSAAASSGTRNFAFLPGPGVPDGMTLAHGGVWIAMWGGARIERFDLSGDRMEPVSVPRRFPTSVAFGGDANDLVAVTAARGDEDGPPDPCAALLVGRMEPQAVSNSTSNVIPAPERVGT
ncbi:SMP-30/gluconolactonase/LRE family protein [Gordonia sp. SCSIO 19800]|uniref:SMP-30/gluconolactonase/LRE family protein n=1 Tax=Gordonia sp. SCSIO 19800 TaxID=2826926 RepID=UPI001B83644A|nr:SMP-30/gluconolactonase/LRE family protein [Gordonia sp. SCSIO 19800]MBR7191548.1 SMP-30/gluconolactonase/LRE family protein [Gordonia sp. SCSIO 19800]